MPTDMDRVREVMVQTGRDMAIRRLHSLECGARRFKECRFDDCNCTCHYAELWSDLVHFELDMLEHGDSLWEDADR